jgi:4a-hydroxytetrahydrobiopterin dehydratase
MTVRELHLRSCTPCSDGARSLPQEDVEAYLEEIHRDWLAEMKFTRIKRVYKFKSFQEGVDFINEIARVANTENHHPNLHLTFHLVEVEMYTNKINGLLESDFIMAAKIDRLYNENLGLIG